jgi:RNA polymerase sigma-70 factor, ECF subfamily
MLVAPPSIDSKQVTGLLRAWNAGDRAALDQLTPLVYAELRQLAHRRMRSERLDHTLQTTALVNEVYLRLVEAAAVDWRDRAHFFAVSARMMRRILVDAARTRLAAKRGGGFGRVNHSTAINFDEIPDAGNRSADWIALDDALHALSQMNPRHARVIELRFFGGLSVEETATVLRISPQSVMRDWKLAKAWLTRELTPSRVLGERPRPGAKSAHQFP